MNLRHKTPVGFRLPPSVIQVTSVLRGRDSIVAVRSGVPEIRASKNTGKETYLLMLHKISNIKVYDI
jgi:hypothetical protein